jgi:hypothetical protein
MILGRLNADRVKALLNRAVALVRGENSLPRGNEGVRCLMQLVGGHTLPLVRSTLPDFRPVDPRSVPTWSTHNLTREPSDGIRVQHAPASVVATDLVGPRGTGKPLLVFAAPCPTGSASRATTDALLNHEARIARKDPRSGWVFDHREIQGSITARSKFAPRACGPERGPSQQGRFSERRLRDAAGVLAAIMESSPDHASGLAPTIQGPPAHPCPGG